jgi:hypothetical protein
MGVTRIGSNTKTCRLSTVLAITPVNGPDLPAGNFFNQTGEHGSSGKILCDVTTHRLVGTRSPRSGKKGIIEKLNKKFMEDPKYGLAET